MRERHLIAELKEHFIKAGFTDSIRLMTEICPIPEGILVMHNSYALMVGCEVLSEGGDIGTSLLQIKEEMHSFIRKILLALENKKGLIVDGYLLIILNQEPEEKGKDVVRDIELDTKVCRKHIVWPLTDGVSLDRLQFVTILSLPEPLYSKSENTTNFELSTEASSLLSEYKRLGNLDLLMSAIKSGELGDVN
ncbi:hypothetical protein [uncultured Gammaproteobacteria bacterium]|nr:hypothetical protein [uncultured Gammaproteobacteria bacterium]